MVFWSRNYGYGREIGGAPIFNVSGTLVLSSHCPSSPLLTSSQKTRNVQNSNSHFFISHYPFLHLNLIYWQHGPSSICICPLLFLTSLKCPTHPRVWVVPSPLTAHTHISLMWGFMLTVDYVEFGLMTILLAVVDLIILGSLIYFLQVEIHFLCVWYEYLCMYTCVYWIT